MAYCTVEDLYNAFGQDNINGWSRLDPDTVDRAIANAGAEIDGYLLSGGYPVPLDPPPANIRKYAIDLAGLNLINGYGLMANDDGSKGIVEQAKSARRYLEKVAEGKYRIPGYAEEGETSLPPSGNVQVSARSRLDLEAY